jgi:hypothetical protein
VKKSVFEIFTRRGAEEVERGQGIERVKSSRSPAPLQHDELVLSGQKYSGRCTKSVMEAHCSNLTAHQQVKKEHMQPWHHT